jgi:hypothetical protein
MKQFMVVAVGIVLASMRQATALELPQPEVSVTRFSYIAKVPAAPGTAATMRVEVKDWGLGASPKGLQIPPRGFYIAQLRSGRILTRIAGKLEKREAGDFWTVQAGQIMTISFPPHCEGAQLRTIAVNPQ